jgi:hypothetical protein
MRKGFALGLVLLGAGGAWLTMRLTVGHGPPSGVEARAVQSAGGTGLEGDRDAEIVELQRRVTRLEQAERARAQKAGEALRAETEAAAEDEGRKSRLAKLQRLPAAELEAKMFASYFASLDDKRRAEGIDPIWAGDMKALLRRAEGGAGALASLSVQSVDCGRTLCRVEITSADEDSKNGAIDELLRKLGPELPQASVQVIPASNRVTAYFARNGTDLPNMESPERLAADLAIDLP